MNKNVFGPIVAFTVFLVLLLQFEDGQAHKLVRRDVGVPEADAIQVGDGQPHSRRKRTIGRIFNMFRGFMSNMFGQGGGQKGKGRGRGRPRPSSSYGAPQSSYGAPPQSSYGAPQSGYNAPSQGPGQSGAPPSLSGGNIDSYGSPQAQALGGGGNLDSYGSPQAPALGGGGNLDSYGSPQAPALGGGNLDSYGSPQAPALGGGNQDSYGSPQAPAIGGGGNLGTYGSPQAPNQNNYGSPQGPPLQNYGNQGSNNAPRVPSGSQGLSSYGNGGGAPRGPPSPGSIAPPGLADSVFKMLPAPNLATEGPNLSGESYGSPNQQQPNQDSYGSPQSNPLGPSVGGGQDPDSYGSPQAGVLSAGGQQGSAQNSYGSPLVGFGQPEVIAARPAQSSNGSPQPAQGSYGAPQNPFLASGSQPAQSSYGSPDAGIVPRVVNNQEPSQAGYGSPDVGIVPRVVNNLEPSQAGYGSPDAGIVPRVVNNQEPSQSGYGGPDAGIVPRVVNNQEPQTNTLDVYGSQVAPVGTSAPVPQDIINSYGSPDGENQPEGELTSTQIEDEGEVQGPAFDNLRDNVGEKQLGTTEASESNSDLKASGLELTGEDDNYDDGATTTIEPVFPGYDDVNYDQNNYQYDDSDVKNAPGLPGYLEGQGNRPVTLPLKVPGRRPSSQNPEQEERVKPVEGVLIREEATKPKVEPVDNSLEEEDDVQPGYGGGAQVQAEKDEEVKDEEEELEEAEEEEEGEEEKKSEAVEEDQSSYDKNESVENDSNQLPQPNETEEYPDNNELGEVAGDEDEEEDKVSGDPSVDSTTGAAFISVPLLIEEVNDKENGEPARPGDPTVILAGSPEEVKKPDVVYGAPGNPRKSRQNDSFHQFLVDVPNAKRQADWSQRLRERQRQRVWRQFQLD
jgi:hypothetical protein